MVADDANVSTPSACTRCSPARCSPAHAARLHTLLACTLLACTLLACTPTAQGEIRAHVVGRTWLPLDRPGAGLLLSPAFHPPRSPCYRRPSSPARSRVPQL